MKWTSTTTLLAALGLALFANRAMAQQGSDPQPFDDLRAGSSSKTSKSKHSRLKWPDCNRV